MRAIDVSVHPMMEGFRPGLVEKWLYRNATRILKRDDAIARTTVARVSE